MNNLSASHKEQVALSDAIDLFIRKTGLLIASVYVVLVVVIITQVVLRKGFASGLIALEELQWHLYAIGVMFGLAYAQVNNAHIRVDLLYGKFSPRKKAWIEIFGMLFLVFPFIAVVFIHSLEFVYSAWKINEHSDAPSGLPYRWLIKSVIPISFGLLFIACISRCLRDICFLARGKH
ncbi:TRAP transporter small permease subunit [Neptuniibacter sp. SY11_33]|uniref:TRAP transporter small permease subunit n=1 Tax=Neptuniibacter sp. SY11_33 TaxID=3398215 RepID=UPI0039F48279